MWKRLGLVYMNQSEGCTSVLLRKRKLNYC